MSVAPRDGENAIINVLRFHEAPNAIVFCNTRAMVSRLTARLSNRGFPVVALSGELTQSERSNALQAMRDGRARVCVATDVAARGIDLPNLDLVIHAELPNSHETLLHRSGRTGRAGRKGVSALIVPPASFKKAQRLLKFAKLTAEWGAAPSAEEVNTQDLQRMFNSDDWQLDISDSERNSVDELLSKFSPEQLAAAYVRQYARQHSAPEELNEVKEAGPKPSAPFGPSVWFALSEGRNENASPRYLLPMICKAGNITKSDVGAIRIAETETYIEIRESSVAGFLEAIGPEMTIEGTKAIVQLDAAPDFQATGKPGFKRGEKSKKGFAKSGKKPPRSVEPKPAKAWKKPERKSSDTPKTDAKPKRDSGKAGDQAAKPPRRPKGPPPPKGKPSSKKNRARAAAAKGGNAMPRRSK
jgi:ATP-dependent RNA helicase DeaD